MEEGRYPRQVGWSDCPANCRGARTAIDVKSVGRGNCTLSIDWEDFGQLFAKYDYGIDAAPHDTIDRQTNIILDLLDETGHKATFFALGMLARHRPQLVRRIAARGHEIAIHGQNHEVMFNLSPEAA